MRSKKKAKKKWKKDLLFMLLQIVVFALVITIPVYLFGYPVPKKVEKPDYCSSGDVGVDVDNEALPNEAEVQEKNMYLSIEKEPDGSVEYRKNITPENALEAAKEAVVMASSVSDCMYISEHLEQINRVGYPAIPGDIVESMNQGTRGEYENAAVALFIISSIITNDSGVEPKWIDTYETKESVSIFKDQGLAAVPVQAFVGDEYKGELEIMLSYSAGVWSVDASGMSAQIEDVDELEPGSV